VGAASLRRALMASKDPRYVPSELELIFDSVWEVIRPRGALGQKTESQLRLALARRLVILAASGITDACELRRQAIDQFMLGR
jgi:hypothetical protein